MPNWIKNGSTSPFNPAGSSVPNMSATLMQWAQPITMQVISKQPIGFEVYETAISVNFRGVVQPFNDSQLFLKPEGQRSWAWYWIHSDPSLRLNIDDVVIYNGVQYRVWSVKDYSLYGYMDYHIVQDFTGSDPVVTP